MEIILTTAETRAILQGCQHTLKLARNRPIYRQRCFQTSKYFSTSNHVVMDDTFQSLGEADGTIER
ncbi:hypothetical protein [aff. Roholtiella sp. LEGE 12411]|uniref:hypothetical protein n=1 Tax=aff. Roholtiella sp. LEGE 12411 TaxID=1828822 RepID=UPI001881B338|nr:hypothetical protein [aff. Roholtiella sp. LEGE 12411]MBE9038653.1 hypothetical protein [aff. Roholtiella sp. LEGE 12411]